MKKFVLLMAFFMCSCSNGIIHIDVSVKSVINEDIDIDKYNKCYIFSEKKDLFKKNFEKIIKSDLSEYGIHIQKEQKNANCFIFFEANISKPDTRTEVDSAPIIGPTSVNSINTNSYGTTNAYGSFYSSGGYTNGSIRGYSNTNSVSNFNYNYGITGYTPVYRTTTVYHRTLNIIAVTKKEVPLWQISAKSSGTSDNLDYIFPFLSLASSSFVKKNKYHLFSFPDNLFSYTYFENEGKFYRFDNQCYDVYEDGYWGYFTCTYSEDEKKKNIIDKLNKVPYSKIRHQFVSE